MISWGWDKCGVRGVWWRVALICRMYSGHGLIWSEGRFEAGADVAFLQGEQR